LLYGWFATHQKYRASAPRTFKVPGIETRNCLPMTLHGRKLFLNDVRCQFSIKIRGAAENVQVDLVQFRVSVSAKVALRKHENSGRSVRLKLVKSLGHYVEPTPFSDSIHNSLKMRSFGYPDAFDMSDEVFHFLSKDYSFYIGRGRPPRSGTRVQRTSGRASSTAWTEPISCSSGRAPETTGRTARRKAC